MHLLAEEIFGPKLDYLRTLTKWSPISVGLFFLFHLDFLDIAFTRFLKILFLYCAFTLLHLCCVCNLLLTIYQFFLSLGRLENWKEMFRSFLILLRNMVCVAFLSSNSRCLFIYFSHVSGSKIFDVGYKVFIVFRPTYAI